MTKKKIFLWTMVLTLAMTTFNGCSFWKKLTGQDGDENNTTNNNTITYTVNDLEGKWDGYATKTQEGSVDISEASYTFDSQGNLISMTGPPNIISVSGNLNVNQSGTIRGNVYTQNVSDTEDYIVENTNMNMEGHFISKTTIEIEIECVWTNTEGNTGSYTVVCDLDKTNFLVQELTFETISKQSYSGHNSSQNYVITETSQWSNLWDIVHSTMTPKPDLPNVNFNNEMVIAVFQGSRLTGGYNIEITKIIEEENFVEVYVKETSPSPGDIVTQALTQPYHIVKTKRVDKKVIFKR